MRGGLYKEVRLWFMFNSSRMLRFLLILLVSSVVICRVVKRYSDVELVGYAVKSIKWQVTLVADLDERSVVPGQGKCRSYILQGNITFAEYFTRVTFEKGPEKEILIDCKIGSRGLELSDIVNFKNEMYTCDDKSGIVYKFNKELTGLEEFVKLKDGDGSKDDGFKCEWMTVRKGRMYIGSHGRPRTNDDGTVKHRNYEWVKVLTKDGRVIHRNWTHIYRQLRVASGHRFPGFLVHEAVAYNRYSKRWYFLPRKASKKAFDPKTEETQGTNLFLARLPSSNKVWVYSLGSLVKERGVTSMKFVPVRSRLSDRNFVVVLKAREVGSETQSFISVYEIQSRGRYHEIVFQETMFSSNKYEGIEFNNVKPYIDLQQVEADL